jgi:hypothetical protein
MGRRRHDPLCRHRDTGKLLLRFLVKLTLLQPNGSAVLLGFPLNFAIGITHALLKATCRVGTPGPLLLRNWSAMSTNVMKSLRFTEFGPPSVLRIQEVAIPQPGVGETLVQVRAAAINPSDIGDVAGRFKRTTLPRTPGRDFAGIAVKGSHPEGAEVWGSSPDLGIVRDGSHAEYVVVPAETVSPKPKALSMAQAAAIGIPTLRPGPR